MERGLLALDTSVFEGNVFEKEGLGRVTGDLVGPWDFWPGRGLALDKLSSNDAVGMRVTRLEGTYIVVRFTALRAADGVKSWTSPAELAESLWTGTVAASADEAKHMITTVNSMKGKCIINCGFENASLSECGGNGFLVSEYCLRHSGHMCGLMAQAVRRMTEMRRQ